MREKLLEFAEALEKEAGEIARVNNHFADDDSAMAAEIRADCYRGFASVLRRVLDPPGRNCGAVDPHGGARCALPAGHEPPHLDDASLDKIAAGLQR